MVRGIFKIIYWGAVLYGIKEAIIFIFNAPNESISKYAIVVSIIVGCLGSGIAVTFHKFLFSKKSFFPFGSLPTPTFKPDFINYTTDEIEGIRWYWSYITYGRKAEINNLTARCPNCNTLLLESSHYYDPVTNKTLVSFDGQIYICDNCGFKKVFNTDLDSLKNKVLRVIDRKVMGSGGSGCAPSKGCII